TLRLRALRPDDRERLIQLVSRLSPESSYFRFFRTTTKLSDEDLNRFTNLDFKRNVALVATVGGDGEEEIVGVGRYAALDPSGRRRLPRPRHRDAPLGAPCSHRPSERDHAVRGRRPRREQPDAEAVRDERLRGRKVFPVRRLPRLVPNPLLGAPRRSYLPPRDGGRCQQHSRFPQPSLRGHRRRVAIEREDWRRDSRQRSARRFPGLGVPGPPVRELARGTASVPARLRW